MIEFAALDGADGVGRQAGVVGLFPIERPPDADAHGDVLAPHFAEAAFGLQESGRRGECWIGFRFAVFKRVGVSQPLTKVNRQVCCGVCQRGSDKNPNLFSICKMIMKPRSNGSYTAATLTCDGAGYDGDAVVGCADAVAGMAVGVVTAVIAIGVATVGAADEQAVIAKIITRSKKFFIVYVDAYTK